MRMNLFAIACSTTLLVSCTGFPFFGKAAPGSAGSTDGKSLQAEIRLENIQYEGSTLSGRLLIGVIQGSLRLDKRLIESIALSLDGVSDCITNEPFDYMVVDILAPRPRQEDVLDLNPGYWFGKEVSIPLFDKRLAASQSIPECIHVELLLHALGGEVVSHLRVRAVRSASPAMDAGMPMDAGATIDVRD